MNRKPFHTLRFLQATANWHTVRERNFAELAPVFRALLVTGQAQNTILRMCTGPVPDEAAADRPGTETSFADSAYTSSAAHKPGTATLLPESMAVIAKMRSPYLRVSCVNTCCASVYCAWTVF